MSCASWLAAGDAAGDCLGALAVLDAAVARIAAAYYERLAPAIDRVWRDEIADIARDLRVWARRLPDDGDWRPEYFEYSFGLSDEGRDPRSVPDPVLVDGRFLLRGSVDLIEQKPGGLQLRVTDHKTGKNRTTQKTIIGGGAALQPVLYSLVVEKVMATPVVSGRLFYCTAAGGFTNHEIPINDQTRRAGLRGARDRRPRGRTGLSAGGAGRPCVRVVRFSNRVRTERGEAHPHEIAGQARRFAVAEGNAMTVLADQSARDAISNALDETLVVEAAAGTGKTTELVKRILRILGSGRDDGRKDRRGHLYREGGG